MVGAIVDCRFSYLKKAAPLGLGLGAVVIRGCGFRVLGCGVVAIVDCRFLYLGGGSRAIVDCRILGMGRDLGDLNLDGVCSGWVSGGAMVIGDFHC